MRIFIGVVLVLPMLAQAQTVEVQPVDIIYGNQVIHGYHQVVLNSPDKVDVIPAQKKKTELLGPNVVVTATGNRQSYLEQKSIAAREQAIYDEVNKRTKEAPFTVLFTGHIPEDIQEKRLRMMPEIGVFGEQLNKIEGVQDTNSTNASQTTDTAQLTVPDTGDFSEITPGKSGAASSNQPPASQSQEDKLEKLIGG